MNLHRLAGVCLALVCISSSAQAEFFWNKKKGGEEPPAVTVLEAPVAAVPSLQPAATDPGKVVEAPASKEKKALYRLKDEETVQALVKLATGRKLREQELVVVARLINEKQLELSGFNGKLKESFGIAEDGNYHYDNETRTIFALKPKPGSDNAPPDANPEDLIERTVQRKLNDKETEETFLKMVGAKKITTDEIRSLQLILQEKKIELTNIEDSLKKQFSMDPDKHYEYDAESRVVYELVMAADPAKDAEDKSKKTPQ